MNQTKYTILVVALFAAAALVGGYLLRGAVDKEPSPELTPVPSAVMTPLRTSALPTATASSPQMHTVTFTAAGPTPKSLTIRAGDAVRFVNSTATEVWPASDPHPAHDACPGFDAGRGLLTGEVYTLTFPTAMSCSYHSHLDPTNSTLRGAIIIQ